MVTEVVASLTGTFTDSPGGDDITSSARRSRSTLP